VNWPGSWPPRDGPPADTVGEGRGLGPDGAAAPSDIVIVGGAGIELNEWRIDVPGRDRLVALAAEQRFSTRPERGGARVALPADGEPFELRLAFGAAYDTVAPGLSLGSQYARGLALVVLAEARAACAEGDAACEDLLREAIRLFEKMGTRGELKRALDVRERLSGKPSPAVIAS
jgi:hypothetical protein